MIKIEKLNPFGRMCISLGMLPSSYKESLTYEEQLLWFFKYLDETVIPTVNNNADAVEELQALYLEIKTYVDEYFENLDVQEEINNKLDDMAESGQLTDIIAQYLQLAGVLAFNNVADLKLAENIVSGSIVKTLSYYNVNNGGGSFYKIRNITNQDVIDEATLIALSDENLVAEIIVNNNTLNLEHFGCYGDGTHDDTLNIQKAINYCNSNNINLVGEKTYLITNTITLKKCNIKLNKIINNGNNNCFIAYDNSIKFEANEIINNSTESALVLEGSSYNVINIKKIDSNGYGITLTPTTSKLVTQNDITLNYVEAELNGIQLIAEDWGISYNNFKFDYIVATNTTYPIYCYAEHNEESEHPAYIGENTFYGGICASGLYGVYAKSMGEGPADLCEITGLKLYNISVESSLNGFYFDNIQYSIIDYPRYQEYDSTNGIIWTLVNKTVHCVFNGTTAIAIPQIDFSELTNAETQYNTINTKIRTKKAGFINGRCGRVYSKGLFFDAIYNFISRTTGLTSLDLTNEEILPQFIRVNNAGSVSLILNVQYDRLGFSDFYVLKTQSTSTITIYDEDGTTVLKTLSSATPTNYHLGFNQDGDLEVLGTSVL